MSFNDCSTWILIIAKEQDMLFNDFPMNISEKYNVANIYPEVVSSLEEKMQLHLEDLEDALPDQLVDRITE